MKFNFAAVLSLLTAFAVAKPTSNVLDFPKNENYMEYSGKNGIYVLHREEGKHFPQVMLAEQCQLHHEDFSVRCIVRDNNGTIMKERYGGSAKLRIPMRTYNADNCDLYKNLVEVVPFDQEGHVQQTLGYLDGETVARRLAFTNTDGCKYYGMFYYFELEKN